MPQSFYWHNLFIEGQSGTSGHLQTDGIFASACVNEILKHFKALNSFIYIQRGFKEMKTACGALIMITDLTIGTGLVWKWFNSIHNIITTFHCSFTLLEKIDMPQNQYRIGIIYLLTLKIKAVSKNLGSQILKMSQILENLSQKLTQKQETECHLPFT